MKILILCSTSPHLKILTFMDLHTETNTTQLVGYPVSYPTTLGWVSPGFFPVCVGGFLHVRRGTPTPVGSLMRPTSMAGTKNK